MQIDGNRFGNLISDATQILNYVMALHILLLFDTLYVNWEEIDQKSPQMCLLYAGGQGHKELGSAHNQVDKNLHFDFKIYGVPPLPPTHPGSFCHGRHAPQAQGKYWLGLGWVSFFTCSKWLQVVKSNVSRFLLFYILILAFQALSCLASDRY